MSKTTRPADDDLRPEYDFASMKGGVRGKYVARLRKGSNLVLLEPEVAAAFPSAEAVNEALRGVLNTTSRQRGTAEQGAAADEPRSTACEEDQASRRGSRLTADVRRRCQRSAWNSPVQTL